MGPTPRTDDRNETDSSAEPDLDDEVVYVKLRFVEEKICGCGAPVAPAVLAVPAVLADTVASIVPAVTVAGAVVVVVVRTEPITSGGRGRLTEDKTEPRANGPTGGMSQFGAR